MRMPTPSASCARSKTSASIGSFQSWSITFGVPSPSLGVKHAYTMAKTRRPKRSCDGSNQRVRRSSKMRSRLMGMRILLIVTLASSAVAFAQNGQRGTQRGNAGTASSQPFDPHDLSGFWDITNIGLPRVALNETSNNRPQMTQWGLEQFRKTRTGDANALTTGAYPNQKDWNDPIQWCD